MDLNDKIVTIRPEVSKTKRRRFVDLSNNAKACLQLFITQAEIHEGPIVTYNYSELRTRRKANWTAAGIENWPQQGMRHTYGSNWLAKHKDINKLVLQSGHDSVDTMWRHYHRGTIEKDAKKFWAIAPKAKKSKIVPMIPAEAQHSKSSAERVNVHWIQDGMRHSFASYWLPIDHDVDGLMGQMGHTDPATFSRHYHAGVPRAEAKKFWAIRPKRSKPGNVIQFKQARAA